MIDNDTKKRLEAEETSLKTELDKIELEKQKASVKSDPFFERQLSMRERTMSNRLKEVRVALIDPADLEDERRAKALEPLVKKAVNAAIAQAEAPLQQTVQRAVYDALATALAPTVQRAVYDALAPLQQTVQQLATIATGQGRAPRDSKLEPEIQAVAQQAGLTALELKEKKEKEEKARNRPPSGGAP